MNRHFSKDDIQKATWKMATWKRYMKKILNGTHDQGNTNRNHSEGSPEWLSHLNVQLLILAQGMIPWPRDSLSPLPCLSPLLAHLLLISLSLKNKTNKQNKTKPQWDTMSYLSEWLKLTTQEIRDVTKDAEKKEPSHTVGRNANWCSHSGKQYGGSIKVKNRTTIWPRNCTTKY